MFESMKSHKAVTTRGVCEHSGPANECPECLEAVYRRELVEIEPDRNWLATYIEVVVAVAAVAGAVAFIIMK